MAADVYPHLARHLDKLPGGYPATESGVELRILRRLFSSDEAELAQHLTLIAEEARVIARRAGLSVEEAARRLDEMERKGLLYARHAEGKPTTYMALQFVVGIYEFQVGRLDAELTRDFEEYLPTLFDASWPKGPQLRTIPIGESVVAPSEILPYESAEALLQTRSHFAVAPCICRQEREHVAARCDRPLESCLLSGSAAKFYVRNGLAREITRDEALALVRQAERTGLVLQPNNARELDNICMCCGCCCGVLRSARRHPRPAEILSSAFQAALDSDACTGCGTCLERCQMDALALADDHAVLQLERCIGCGLCVSTCPSGALALQRRPAAKQPSVPKDMTAALLRLGQARGMLRAPELVKMVARSAVDRLLSPR